MSIFTGAGVALVTPFKEDLSVDYDQLEKFIDFQINAFQHLQRTKTLGYSF